MILKTGILSKERKIKCTLCGCKFKTKNIYRAKTIFDIDALYADCPECGKAVFIKKG
jgi:DNA-directed RNA polymerase subunit RPC12/RpoP